MKTTKILSVISFVLIVLGASAINPDHVSQVANPSSTGNIKYTVTLHVNAPVFPSYANFYIVLKDGSGQYISRPQKVGSATVFYFSEIGPVRGSRVASLIEVPQEGAYIPFYCNPDIKTGLFRNGVTYMFNLYPSFQQPN